MVTMLGMIQRRERLRLVREALANFASATRSGASSLSATSG
jgi:hypothetical protein